MSLFKSEFDHGQDGRAAALKQPAYVHEPSSGVGARHEYVHYPCSIRLDFNPAVDIMTPVVPQDDPGGERWRLNVRT